MNFLYEKQARYFYSFLAAVCIMQTFFFGIVGILHVRGIRHVLVERELAASSYLLEQEIPSAVIASAWNHTEVTEAVFQLFGKVEQTALSLRAIGMSVRQLIRMVVGETLTYTVSGVIVAVMLISVCLAVAGPIRQIKEMSVVDTISTE